MASLFFHPRNPPAPVTCPSPPPWWRAASRFLLLGLAYGLVCRISYAVAPYQSGVSALWPAAGLGLAATFQWGWRAYPAIWVGGLLSNLSVNPLPAALLTMSGDTLSYWLAVAVVRRYHTLNAKDRPFRLFIMLLIGSLLSSYVSPSWEYFRCC